MGVKDLIKETVHYVVATSKNAISLESTTREGRLTISIIISLVFFFTFLSITGDIISAGCLTTGLEIFLLYSLSIM